MKFILLAFAIINQQLAQGQTIESVSFESNLREERIDLTAELRIPKDASSPAPVVIIQHSSGPDIQLSSFKGYTDSIGYAIGEAAMSRGYAVLYMDTFTPRKITKDRSGDVGIGTGVAIRDLKALLRVISRDNRIDRSRMFLFGHSYGGGVALTASYDTTWGRRNPFRAIVTSAPGCQAFTDSAISSPTKLFVGEKDDYTSPSKCISLVNHYREKQSRIEIEVVKNVTHSYSYSGTWLAGGQSRTGCENMEVKRSLSGQLTINGKAVTEKEFNDMCMRYGRTAGGNGEQVGYLAQKTLDFFKSTDRQ